MLGYSLLLGIFAVTTISYAEKPTLVSKTKDIAEALGENAILACTFQSNLPLKITWSKNNQSMTFDDRVFNSKISNTMDSLNILRIQISDAGTYTCTGANTEGTISGSITVSLIKSIPKINVIEDVYLRPGQNVTVPCSADAIPSATYSWARIGKMFDSNVMEFEGQLKIDNAIAANAGKYRCTAKNVVGERSVDFNVTIINSGIRWFNKLRSFENVRMSDMNFVLTVSFATADKGSPTIKWFKDSILLSSSQHRTIVTTSFGARYTSKLYLRQINTGDSGIYKFNIDSSMVSEISLVTNLTVWSRPIIEIDEGVGMFVLVGEDAVFTCIANAFPRPTLEWKKNDTVISTTVNAAEDVTYEGARTTFTLTLKNLEVANSGMYTCHGTNNQGQGSKSIKLSVRYGRVITTSDNEKIMYSVVGVSVTIIIIIVVVAILYIRFRDRWCPSKYTQANGLFYTDLVQEEKEVSSVADIESNPHSIKKNINISMKRGDRLGTISGTTKDQAIRGRSLKQSIKQSMSLKRPGAGNTLDNHYARLGTVVCQGKAIDFKHIVFDECLGEGEYGMVNGGRIIDDENKTVCNEVSIKMLKEDYRPQDWRDMLAELRMMRRVSKHKNIITLIGWCIADDNVYVVEEFVPFGSVLTFLRAQRCLMRSEDALDQLPEEDRVDERTLLSFGVQIASGMKHLARLQVVHRDLACRNVYLGHEKTCKISEYGLIRDIYAENVYRKTTGGQLPVRWMAREAIFEGQYTHQSDVWSFGILLWELATLGKIPYPGIVRTEHLLEEIECGYHMENPGNISTDFFLLMSQCWNRDPSTRPNFDKIEKKLNDLLNDSEEVHIDIDKLFHAESEDNEEMLIKSPTGDFHRPNFPTVKESTGEQENADQITSSDENAVKA